MTVTLGLTGPIGCGKSTVARLLVARGAVAVDADIVARDVSAPGQPAHDAVLERFGDGVRAADGTLDRAALARLVFADPVALRDLEAIVHPVVRPRILAAIEAAEADQAPAIVVEAIKLVEGGLAELCDEVWLVDCSADEQLDRLAKRGMAVDDAERRVAAQAGLRERLTTSGAVTRVLSTSGGLDMTVALVEAGWTDLLTRSERAG